ncbi:transglutaminase-like domain-containing protein [Methanocella arvoryzae]|nr:transglutaminase-like domain-containing protein [Methanocella arvoryzae]
MLLACLLFIGVMVAVVLFYGALSGSQAEPVIATPTAGNISFVSADLDQWQPLGSSHSSTVTFRRDYSGVEEISGNLTFSLPDDGYSAKSVSFKNWTRGSDLTLEFDYTVPPDGYAGAISPEFRLDLDEVNETLAFDYLDETGKYIFVTFAISDPDPAGDNLGNDDLSTLVPTGYYDQRFFTRQAEAYNNSLHAAMGLTNGVEPYRTKDLYGAMKNLTSYVNRQMTSDTDRWQKDPYYGEFTQSDWYIGFNQSGYGPRYHGICKDYVSLARSYYRSMGIPAKFIICVEKNRNDSVYSHAWLEAWDGSRWIHADPTWNVFDNPRHYKENGYYDIQIRELSVCVKKPTSIKTSGVDDLIFQAWIYWDWEDRLDFDVVVDRGMDPMYN